MLRCFTCRYLYTIFTIFTKLTDRFLFYSHCITQYLGNPFKAHNINLIEKKTILIIKTMQMNKIKVKR